MSGSPRTETRASAKGEKKSHRFPVLGALEHGAAFVTYGSFVRRHAEDLRGIRCRGATIHGSAGLFFAYHRSLLGDFSRAYTAAGGPGGVPAWDPTASNATAFLGGPGGGVDGAVREGPFAGWPVPVWNPTTGFGVPQEFFKNLYRRQIELVSNDFWTVRPRSPSSRRLKREHLKIRSGTLKLRVS